MSNTFTDNLEENIQKYGHTILSVFDLGAYSIGMAEQDLPDILITLNIDPKIQQTLINDICAQLKQKTIAPGHLEKIITAPAGVYLLPVTDIATLEEDYAIQAVEYYKHYRIKSKMSFLQLVFPDKDGFFPWDEKYNDSHTGNFLQKMLCNKPTIN